MCEVVVCINMFICFHYSKRFLKLMSLKPETWASFLAIFCNHMLTNNYYVISLLLTSLIVKGQYIIGIINIINLRRR